MNKEQFIEQIAQYVRKYAPQFGIKVCSPIIAQAILESAWGTSEKAKHNNFFGLKYRKNRVTCHTGFFEAGGSEQLDDGTYQPIKDMWYAFADMEMGVLGYFQFVSIPNYLNLKDVTDPQTYLENIKADGYATSLNYVSNLMNVINNYSLTQYDKEDKVMPKVFLSAGHGGSDPGASANGLKEKDINLNTLLACRDMLERNGVKVVCSRTSDVNDPVGDEVKEANASGADIAVSFHANAGGGNGFEAFYYSSNPKGKKLAALGEKYVKQLGQNSRGLKAGDKLKFVRATTMPAVLFESFFVDNDADVLIGDTVAEQRKFGTAYAKAILEYFGIVVNDDTSVSSGAAAGKALLYVQCGAFRDRKNAEALVARLKADGYPAIIKM